MSDLTRREFLELLSVVLPVTILNCNSSKNKDFTFNDYTRHYTSDLINLWRDYGLKEFVLFKDPTKSPYLCDYPSMQKGFKRPPS